MNTINPGATSPYVSTVQGSSEVNAVNAQASAKVETPVLTPPAPSPSAPILLPPGRSDYAGASAVMSAYTSLIVLMCEVNRESYAANRAMANMQMTTRVSELHHAADKRRTAAIVGLVMGVISGTVGIAGGAAGMTLGSKGVTKLKKLQTEQMTLDNVMPEKKKKMEGFGSKDVAAQQTTMPQAQAPGNTTQQAHKVSEKNPVKDGETPKASGDKSGEGKSPVRGQKEINIDLSIVDAESSRTQSMSVLFRALQEAMSTTGQSVSGLVSAEADDINAEAERTEGSRQITISNMNQFQDLMSKFTQILSSLLEAENKARSAAAQA